MSLSRPRGDRARARFQATVAGLGEPATSTFEAAEAEALLARTGWQLTAAAGDDRPGPDRRRDRLRVAGLLLASAGPAAPAGAQPRPHQTPSRQTPSRQTPSRQTPSRQTPSRPPAPGPSQPPQGHDGALPLSALLSQALVAFTIEFDNEAEHRLPHRTTSRGMSGPGDGDPEPWLVSLAMWENCMRYVTGEPITVGDLEARARTCTYLDGMRRWGYITIDGTARKVHNGHPGPGAVLRATAAGLRAREICSPWSSRIQQRWGERFGADQLGHLRDPLSDMVGLLDPGCPDGLLILGPALLSAGPDPRLPPRPDGTAPETMPLPALLSRILLSFAVEYEREAGLSLAVAANVLRVLGTEGTRLRDLPALTGTSKESVRWTLGILTRCDLAAEEPDPAASRGRSSGSPRGA